MADSGKSEGAMGPSARELDQFYTKPEAAKRCWELLQAWLKEHPQDFDRFLEPSAGAGAFFRLMPKGSRLGMDLDPKIQGVEKEDFLSAELPEASYLTVGNPPFGKNASLAVKFFNKSAKLGPVIAMIFPLTFRKRSLQARLDHSFHLELDEELPKSSFTLDGEDYDVPCAFQIWARKEERRKKEKLPMTHGDFKFVAKGKAQLAIQRVGVNAGKVKASFSHVAEASHYFVAADGATLEKVRKILESIDWAEVKYNTAGNPSVSKTELVKLYEAAKAKLGAG